MKKFRLSVVVLTIIAVLCSVLLFTACTKDEGLADNESFTIVIDDNGAFTEYTVKGSEAKTVEKALKLLSEKEDNFVFSETGGFINEVGTLKNDAAANAYIMIYTSVEKDFDKDFDVSQYATTTDYKGVTLTLSGVGFKEMHVEEGAIILFKVVKF